MAINVNWQKLRGVQKYLAENHNLAPETEIVCIMILKNGSAKKSIIKFKEFFAVFWAISENKEYQVSTLVIQDDDGRILYRHRELTKGDEEIPDGGHSGVILYWNTLTQEEKDTYLQILVAQINAQERI